MAHTHARLRIAADAEEEDNEEIKEAQRRREAEEVKEERMLLCPCFSTRYSLKYRWKTFKQTWRKRIQKKEQELGFFVPQVETEVLVHEGSVFQTRQEVGE